MTSDRSASPPCQVRGHIDLNWGGISEPLTRLGDGPRSTRAAWVRARLRLSVPARPAGRRRGRRQPAVGADHLRRRRGQAIFRTPRLDACASQVVDQARYLDVVRSRACATVYCGAGECASTAGGGGCVCAMGQVARTFSDLDGEQSVTCVPAVPPVDLAAGGLELPDPCDGVECGDGACVVPPPELFECFADGDDAGGDGSRVKPAANDDDGCDCAVGGSALTPLLLLLLGVRRRRR